jgi:glucokinase
MNKKKLNIGVDIGGTTISTGILNETGKVLFQNSIKTNPEGGSDKIIMSVIINIRNSLSGLNASVSDVNSIGIGVPGTADTKKGVVVFAPNLFWQNVSISGIIKDAFKVPVFLGQDSRAAAWAEFLIGSGKGYKNIASVTLGTGIGCGMILDGKLFHGGLNTAGELGHTIVELNGNICNCGKIGCLEAHSAGLAIVREGKKISGIQKLINKSVEEISVKDVFSLSQSGNSAARRITDSVVSYLGIAFVNLINVNSLELISISGGISNAPKNLLIDPLRKFINERAYSAVADKVKLVRSSLGDNAPMIGAALLDISTQ